MPIFDQHCLTCDWTGEILVPWNVHPPCAVCGGETERLWRSSPAVIPDTIRGGQVLENLGPEPVHIESRSQLRHELASRGLQPAVRHVGTPGEGSDKSVHTSRWV